MRVTLLMYAPRTGIGNARRTHELSRRRKVTEVSYENKPRMPGKKRQMAASQP